MDSRSLTRRLMRSLVGGERALVVRRRDKVKLLNLGELRNRFNVYTGLQGGRDLCLGIVLFVIYRLNV